MRPVFYKVQNNSGHEVLIDDAAPEDERFTTDGKTIVWAEFIPDIRWGKAVVF